MIIFKIFTKDYSCLVSFNNPDMFYCLGFYVADCLVISLDTIAMKIYIRWSTSFDVECGCMEKWRDSQEIVFCTITLLVNGNSFGRRKNLERFTGYCIFLPFLFFSPDPAKTVDSLCLQQILGGTGIGRWHIFEVLRLRGRPLFSRTPSQRTGSPGRCWWSWLTDWCYNVEIV